MLRLPTVLQHLDLLQRDEAFRHHLVEDRKQAVDLLLRVHDLDDDGQVLGEPQDARRVEDAPGAETGLAIVASKLG